MKAAIYKLVAGELKEFDNDESVNKSNVDLVLAFGEKALVKELNIDSILSKSFGSATRVVCSTAGEIFHTSVSTESISVLALEFEKSHIQAHSVQIKEYSSSFEAGQQLIGKLSIEGLRYVLVISDGALVNGSELVLGIASILPPNIPVTGGLAGDGARFESTLVGLNGNLENGLVVALGFYGEDLEIGHGSMGGWEMFGPERKVSRSTSNVLFEIEGKNALDLYKAYLGPYASELPGSALFFPLSVKVSDSSEPIVRTILSIDEQGKSMTFAGDIPEGSMVRFMKANFDKIIDAASDAANQSLVPFLSKSPKAALLVSCVGRRLILNNRVDEEVEAVHAVCGPNTKIAGFYSYGEISPFSPNSKCELHNQTMTITTFDER